MKIELKGERKSGEYYPEINYYELTGPAVSGVTNYVPNNDGNFFYWGRRGPSMHLNYQVDSSFKVEWFYNELTVPVEEDKVSSYFMANGLSAGYFGIQVNSETERFY